MILFIGNLQEGTRTPLCPPVFGAFSAAGRRAAMARPTAARPEYVRGPSSERAAPPAPQAFPHQSWRITYLGGEHHHNMSVRRHIMPVPVLKSDAAARLGVPDNRKLAGRPGDF